MTLGTDKVIKQKNGTNIFKLTRIQKIEPCDETYVIDDKFNPEDYFKYSLGVFHIHGAEPIEVNLVSYPDVKEPVTVLLPKNTEVILAESTTLVTIDPSTNVTVLGQSKVTLPPGTEITVTKINYYAILFYIVLAIGTLWLYMKNKDEDRNNDGLVDVKPSEEVKPTE